MKITRESNSSSKKQAKDQTYKQVKLLGQGSFGKAYLVECSSDKVILI